ncbi:hypothetical protein P3786_16910 [Pseudomonas aeruginosa]|nr:hypothetical protein [Pseudomonas aeruginosa]
MRDWVKNRRGQPEKLKNTGQTYIMIEKCETLDMLEWAIERARAALAQPSPDAPYADGIAADLERSDWTPEDALRWYAAGKHFDTVNGRTRIIDTGAVASNALKHLSLPYLEMKGDAELTELREAMAQPSPAQAEGERPEVVAYLFVKPDGTLSMDAVRHKPSQPAVSVMTVAQHERIVGALRAVITQLRQHKNDYMDAGQETYRALQNEIKERVAEIARLDGLVSGRTAERDAALAEVERLRESKGDPVGSLEKCMKVMYERDEHAKRLEVALARVAELERELRDEENAHTTTIEQRDNAEHWADQLAKAIAERFGVDIGEHSNLNCPWNEALVWMQQPPTQAQHSVPAAWYYDAPSQAEAAIIDIRGMWGEDDCPTYEDVASALRRLLAAAPGKEGV